MAETTHFAGKLILKYDTSSALRNKRVAFWARGSPNVATMNPPDPARLR